jgi:tetratricopeptide (TPR) repeat protein
MLAPLDRRRRRPLWPVLVALTLLPGCGGEAAVLVAIALGASLGAWFVGSDRQQRALYAAARLRRAIETGKQRDIEFQLRRQLALAAAGEAVSPERQWLARAQLGGLLVAEWRLDEARTIYGGQNKEQLAPHLRHLANYGEHELHLLENDPSESDLEQIRSDRDACLEQVPGRYKETVARAWGALEGLALSRMGRSRDAARVLEASLPSLDFNPARVIYLFHLGQAYEQIGERELAGKTYAEAAAAFPGTRLASEAKARTLALGDGGAADGMFRGMLPEAPQATSSALVPVVETPTDDER